MSKLTESQVVHVSRLAKLILKQPEIEKFKVQLTKIFDFVDSIGEMKTQGVNETNQLTAISNRFRKDEVSRVAMLSQKEALSGAKRTYKGYFLVKAIFGK